MKNFLKLLLCIALPLIVLLLPLEAFPLDGITEIEKRVVAVFVWAALSWVLEPIPIYATSLVIITLLLILVSDSGVNFLIQDASPEFGTTISYQSILATFASPIILLFLGGFFLAIAASKFRLDQNLARVLLRPFGTKPAMVMLGLMLITAVFSMFMSNTATTAMMLAILTPVLAVFKPNDPGKIAFTLAIPVAANIGGIGTPIGTPPNAIALEYLTGANEVTFSQWMTFGVPFVIVLLTLGWLLLRSMYKIVTPHITLNIQGKFMQNPKARIVYATFIATIILWLTDFIHGMNAYVVAMIPVTVFSATGIVNKADLKNISWDILWLVSGGIALGMALEKSGLAQNVVDAIPFNTYPLAAVLIGLTVIAMLMATFMSNTATANLLLPLVAALGVSMAGIAAVGGAKTLILSVTLASSMGLALPVSTPPNALAFGTGFITTAQMSRIGIILAGLGLLLIYVMVYIGMI